MRSAGLSLVGVTAYFAALLVTRAAWTLRYLRAPRPRAIRAIVVLGASLSDGRVTPLLAARLDRAIAVARAAGTGGPPVIVVSGGAGDGAVTEAGAMADYLLAHGIDERSVRREPLAVNTIENLSFAQALLADEGIDDDIVVVTSGFHARRTTEHARDQGLQWPVLGASTPPAALPKAFLREFVANIFHRRHVHTPVVIALAAAPFILRRTHFR